MGAAPRFGFTTPPQVATLPAGLVSFERPNLEYEKIVARPATYQPEALMWITNGTSADHPSRPKVKITKAQKHLIYKRARLAGKARRAALEMAGYKCTFDASWDAAGCKLDKLLGIERPSDRKKVVRP